MLFVDPLVASFDRELPFSFVDKLMPPFDDWMDGVDPPIFVSLVLLEGGFEELTPGLEDTFLRGTKPGYGNPGNIDLDPLPELPVWDNPSREPGNPMLGGLFTRKEGMTGFDLGFGGITRGVDVLLKPGMDLGGTGVFARDAGNPLEDFDCKSFNSNDCPS